MQNGNGIRDVKWPPRLTEFAENVRHHPVTATAFAGLIVVISGLLVIIVLSQSYDERTSRQGWIETTLERIVSSSNELNAKVSEALSAQTATNRDVERALQDVRMSLESHEREMRDVRVAVLELLKKERSP